MGHVRLSYVGSLILQHCSTLSPKRHNFRGNVAEHKMSDLIFSTILSEALLILRRTEQEIILNVQRSACKLPVILFRFQ